jgi:hypothetical protein
MTCHKEEGETATPIMREDMLVVVSFASNDSHRSQETHLTGLGAKLTNAAIHPRVRYSSLPSSRMETQDYHHNNLRVSKINGLYQLSQESFGFNPYVSVNLARIPHDASLVQVSKTRMHGWWRSGAISWNSCVHSTSKPMPLFNFLCTWRRGDTHGHSMELFVWLVLDSSIGHHPTINKFYVWKRKASLIYYGKQFCLQLVVASMADR